MSTSVIEALLGCVAAVAATVVLAVRLARAPGAVAAAWAVAGLGLVVSLGAQVLGFHRGFGPTTFRAMELGGQVVAPLALCLGLAEVAAKSVAVRFAARLILPALALVVVVILATDPLNTTAAFSTAWPAPASHYEFIPNKLLEYGLGPVTAVVALIAAGFALGRTGREPAWRQVAVPVSAAALAALALAVAPLSVLLKVALPLGSAFVLLCLAAAVLTLIGGLRIDAAQLDSLRRGVPPRAGQQEWGGQEWGQAEWADEYWEGPHLAGAAPEDLEPGPGGYPVPPGYGQEGEYGQAGRYADNGEATSVYSRRDFSHDGDTGRAGAAGDAPEPGGELSAEGQEGPAGSAPSPAAPAAGGPDPRDARERLFGQIAIYTLVEDRVSDFDQLAEQVVAKVRAREPGTLVYILHAVPSAPLQRILYEVYRDRAAFEEHQQRPYVTRFESESEPFVLATNMIELGLQQAKVSPFPAIASLFGEPGGEEGGPERTDPRAGQSGRLTAGPEAPGSGRPL